MSTGVCTHVHIYVLVCVCVCVLVCVLDVCMYIIDMSAVMQMTASFKVAAS